jgi:hypothetical protein
VGKDFGISPAFAIATADRDLFLGQLIYCLQDSPKSIFQIKGSDRQLVTPATPNR